MSAVTSRMISVSLTSQSDFAGWRNAARALLAGGVPPEQILWHGPGVQPSLLEATATPWSELKNLARDTPVTVSSAFVSIAKRVLCHRDPERFARLYRILWRMKSEPRLLGLTTDADIIWLTECDKAIRRDRHKMHAFVRFRKVGVGRYKREQFAAWFEPSHYITELATPFFKRRFPNMDWIIVTPDRSAIWDGTDLKFAAGGQRADVPGADDVEDQWKVYFNSIFNPARLKVGAMMSEMPKKYWKNMPEAVDIPAMIKSAKAREMTMRESGVSAAHPLAETLRARAPSPFQMPESFESLSAARKAIQKCQLCPLHCHASQAVFGEGPEEARLMIIGEQPGDAEDIAGRPFVGPAGKVLDDVLSEAGIARGDVYLTNAVKHFKFKTRGKRRIHDTPNANEIDQCRWWVETERRLVKPDVIITLGASAARAVIGRSVKISDIRGRAHSLKDGTQLFATIHPAYLLRNPDVCGRQRARETFIRDLKMARAALG